MSLGLLFFFLPNSSSCRPRCLIFYFLNICHSHESKQTNKQNKKKKQQEGKQLYHLRTHSGTIRMFVQVQTCWQHWTHITKMRTSLRNLVVIGSGLHFLKNNSRKITETRMKSNRVGQNVAAEYHQWIYQFAGTKCWYSSGWATSLPTRFLRNPSCSPWHCSPNEALFYAGTAPLFWKQFLEMTLYVDRMKERLRGGEELPAYTHFRRRNRSRLIPTEVCDS